MGKLSKDVLLPFEQAKEYTEERINMGIEAHRKGFATLEVLNQKGEAVPAHIEIKQKTHDFKFGCNLFMLEELESDDKNEEYKKAFAELFNLATLPFYWSDLEPTEDAPRFSKDSPKVYRRPAPDLCTEYCKESGIEPKLHCLNYDQWSPVWLPTDVPTVKRLLDKRIARIAERYKDVIPSMEVVNESLCNLHNHPDRRSTEFFKEEDFVEWSFEHARKYLPANHLIINEATQDVWGDFKYNRSRYYMQIERALSKGASIDSVGMQYHMFYSAEDMVEKSKVFYDPKTLYAVMDRYSDFRKPLQVTEVTIPAYSAEADDEELQAEIITRLYKIWFSHPNMEAIVYWNMIDGYAAFAPKGDMTAGENKFHGALMRFDLSKKPAYHALKKLIHETWKTRLSLDAASASFKGFYGKYDLTVTVGDKTVTKEIHIRKGAENRFKITV